MVKKTRLVSLMMALVLGLGMGAVALADDEVVEWIEHEDHEHYVVDGVDRTMVTLTKDTKVHGTVEPGEVIASLSAGDRVCVIRDYGNGWAHVYYNNGNNAGWIETSAWE